MSESLLEVLRRFNEAFNRHDVNAMMGLMSDDCVFENTYPPPDGERFAGQEPVHAYWTRFFRGSPQANLQIEEVFVSGDRGFQRWRYQWAEGKYVRGVDVFRFGEDKIVEKLSYVKG